MTRSWRLWAWTALSGALAGLGVALLTLGLWEALFGNHLRGLLWVVCGPLLLHDARRAWARATPRKDDHAPTA